MALLASSGEPILPQLAVSPTDGLVEQLALELDPPQELAEPPRAQQSFPITVPAVPPALRALIAELRPTPDQPHRPVAGSSQAKPHAEPPLVLSSVALPQVRARKILTIPSRETTRKPDALPTAVAKPAAPQTPHPQPAPSLAPLTNYQPLAGRPMRPAVPERKIRQSDSVPRTTLPGPMLTARLVKFRDSELNPIFPEARLVKKRLIPGWLATALIVGTVLGAGFNSVFSIVPRSGSEAKAPVGAVEAAEPSPVATSSAGSATSLSKTIEVTGFLIRVEPGKKSEIQYLVVNHTPNPFSGVTVYVTLHTANALAGQAPLGKFAFLGPKLGPYASKEMSSAIEGVTRPITMPDWQDLRADVEIGP